MRRIAVVSLMCACASGPPVDGTERSIPFVAKIGDRAKVRITHERSDKSNDVDKMIEMKLVYQAEIVGGTNEGFKLTWYPRSLTVNGQTVDTTTERPEVDHDIALEFETNDAGTPQALSNHKAVIENGLRVVEQGSARNSEDILKSTRAMFEKMTPEAAAGVFGKYATLIGFFQGLSLEVGNPRAYKDQLPNPFGAGFIQADGSITLTSVDEQRGLAAYEWHQTIDPESFKQVVDEMMTTMTTQGTKPIDENAIDAISFDLRCRAFATVRLSDGWLSTLSYELNAIGNDGKEERKRSERYDIAVER